ncbi:MAG: antitoxin family protein [Chloroflexi bacterium]|nr:antitoxin family protein [Chloroflexota bacterium]
MRSIRGRYANGVLTPLEPLDLSEGCEVSVDLAVDNDAGDTTTERAAANSSILDVIDEIHRDFPNAFTGMPHDGAQHYKHYLYGHPKDAD